MKDKVAIFVDWENVRLDIQNIQKNHKDRHKIVFNYNSVTDVFKLFHATINDNERLYRIFFYSAEPISFKSILKSHKENSTEHQNILKLQETKQEKYEKMEKLRTQILEFLHNVSVQPHVALRLGELRLQGFFKDGTPKIVQKQVDMLMGLDISHLAYRQLVDKIIVFCKDADMIPALKCARINGIEVNLAHIVEGYKIGDKLLKHSDCVREISLLKDFAAKSVWDY